MLPVNLQRVLLFAKANLAATASAYLAHEPDTNWCRFRALALLVEQTKPSAWQQANNTEPLLL